MKELTDYLHAVILLSPLFMFIIAVGFRLLDNSGYLFLQKEIVIDSSYVSLKNLQDQVEKTSDNRFKRKLKLVLVYRKMHRIFLFLMVLTLPLSLWCYITLY